MLTSPVQIEYLTYCTKKKKISEKHRRNLVGSGCIKRDRSYPAGGQKHKILAAVTRIYFFRCLILDILIPELPVATVGLLLRIKAIMASLMVMVPLLRVNLNIIFIFIFGDDGAFTPLIFFIKLLDNIFEIYFGYILIYSQVASRLSKDTLRRHIKAVHLSKIRRCHQEHHMACPHKAAAIRSKELLRTAHPSINWACHHRVHMLPRVAAAIRAVHTLLKVAAILSKEERRMVADILARLHTATATLRNKLAIHRSTNRGCPHSSSSILRRVDLHKATRLRAGPRTVRHLVQRDIPAAIHHSINKGCLRSSSRAPTAPLVAPHLRKGHSRHSKLRMTYVCSNILLNAYLFTRDIVK